jgi:hypothetical protein
MSGLCIEDLERIASGGCQVEGCKNDHPHEFFFHARCHPTAGTWVSYKEGTLTIICRECRKLVAEVAVARRPS